jgi:hypothetical protein
VGGLPEEASINLAPDAKLPFVDHVANVRHRSHKLVSAIVAF